ncbi:MAG: twin-arginine translocation signal domain-containing protein [Candidatus Omnitrophica bacterium]|nr:twin-arginine translocation signal domain-containing protein [Candidatus Omnitrophota bacterium]
MKQTLTRRQFLGATAAGGAWLLTRLSTRPLIAAEADTWPKLPAVKIYKVYVGRTGDFYLAHPTEELAKFDNYLGELERKLGDVKFIGGDLIPPTDAGQVAEKLTGADGVLLIHLSGHGGDAPVLGKLIEAGLPTALFSQPFSGHGWMYFPQWHKQHKKVVLLPSSDWSEIDRVVGLMRVPAWLRRTRILAVGGPHGTAAACSAEAMQKQLGAEMVIVPNERVSNHAPPAAVAPKN